MNVLKIYNNKKGFLRNEKILYLLISLCCFSNSVFAEDVVKDLAQPIEVSNVLSVILGLLFVLAVFFVLVYFLKHIPSLKNQHSGVLKILDTLYLGSNEKIILLDVGDKQIVVGVNSQTINTLYVMDEMVDIEVSDNKHNIQKAFSKIFSEKLSS